MINDPLFLLILPDCVSFKSLADQPPIANSLFLSNKGRSNGKSNFDANSSSAPQQTFSLIEIAILFHLFLEEVLNCVGVQGTHQPANDVPPARHGTAGRTTFNVINQPLVWILPLLHLSSMLAYSHAGT